MNLELCKFWGIIESISEEEWNDLYTLKLFELKKQVLEQFFLPKLIKKRLEDCSRVLQIQAPGKRFIALEQFHYKDLKAFEQDISEVKMRIHQSCDFEDLFLGMYHLLAVLEGYRELIIDYTEVWGDEWKSVEVNSREVFPSGLFLQSIKDGRSTLDWKESLLKERKRITIVF